MRKKKPETADPSVRTPEAESDHSVRRRVKPSDAVISDELWTAALGVRGFGSLFLPVYTDKKTGERKTSSVWWLKWGHDGKRFKESTKTSDKGKAEDYRKRKFAEIWGGRAPWEPRPDVTLGDILRRALQRAETRGKVLAPMRSATARLLGQPPKIERVTSRAKKERERVAAVRLGAGERMLANRVNEATIDAYMAARKAQGYSAATINRDLAQLRRAFNIAFKTVDEYGNPLVKRVPSFELLAEADPRMGFYSEAEFRAIRDRLPGCLPWLVDFYRTVGWRKREVLAITWARVDTVEGLIQLDPGDTKARSWRDPIPYREHPVLREVVEHMARLRRQVELARGRIVTHLFFRETGDPIRSFDDAWRAARKAAGLPNKSIHDFRRTAARDLAMALGDRKKARRVLGAKTDSIFDRYNVTTVDDMRDSMAKLARYQQDRGAVEQIVIPFEKKKASGDD
jgi:integrase